MGERKEKVADEKGKKSQDFIPVLLPTSDLRVSGLFGYHPGKLF